MWSAIVFLRILTTPKSRPIALGFFVNRAERSIHPALAPEAAFIRVNFPRPKRGWTSARFSHLLKKLAAMTSDRDVEAIVWGYRDRINHGIDVGTYFDQCWRIERALIEPPNAAGNAFVAGHRSIYFDGRESTDLERRLNALAPGRLPQSEDGRRLLAHIIEAALTKYAGAPATVRLTGRDLLIVGQCAGDQAIEHTDAMARDNPGLVELAAKHLLADGHGFERVFFKPHPKSRTAEDDVAYIHERYPAIRIIDGGADIVSVLEGKPAVATLTSGVGLEASVRGCKVHTFGISFYSHWGFTVDHMPCERRTNRLSAADVLLYVVMRHTRYVDPTTWQPTGALEAFGLTPSVYPPRMSATCASHRSA